MDILLGWTSFTLMSQPLAAYHYSFSRIEMNLHLVSHLCLDGEIYFDRKSIFLRFLEPKRPVAVSGDSRYSTPALANCGHPKEVLQRNVEEDPQKELVGQVVPRDVCWGLKRKGAQNEFIAVLTRSSRAGQTGHEVLLHDAASRFLLDLLARTNWPPSFSLPLLASRWCLWSGDHCWMSSVGVHSISRPSPRHPLDRRLHVLRA